MKTNSCLCQKCGRLINSEEDDHVKMIFKEFYHNYDGILKSASVEKYKFTLCDKCMMKLTTKMFNYIRGREDEENE